MPLNISTLPAHLYLRMSLYCCDGFKVNICGKSSLDHHQYQAKYDSNELIEFITDNEELIDYNERDVLSVLIIYSNFGLFSTSTQSYSSFNFSK